MTVATRPVPAPDVDTGPFFEAAARGELRFQQCSACGAFRHPPLPMCPTCRSTEHEWTLSAGLGSLYSWTVVQQAAHPAFSDVPYVIAVVQIDDCGGPKLMCNLDASPDQLTAGAPIEVYFERRGSGALPQARLRP